MQACAALSVLLRYFAFPINLLRHDRGMIISTLTRYLQNRNAFTLGSCFWFVGGLLAVLTLTTSTVWGGASKPAFTVRIHVQADESAQESTTYIIALSDPDELVRIDKLPIVNERYITSATLMANWCVLLQLNDTGKHSLEVATSTKNGKVLVVFWGGRPVYSAVIDMPIRSGRIFIPPGITPEELAAMDKFIQSRARM